MKDVVPPPPGWCSPESIPPVHPKHIRVLENRLNHLLGRAARGNANSFHKAEIGALLVAIAELNEVLEKRVATGDRALSAKGDGDAT